MPTNTGWAALRGLRARVSARSEPGRGCSLSPSSVLFLVLLCPVPAPLPSSLPFLHGHGVVVPAGLTLH